LLLECGGSRACWRLWPGCRLDTRTNQFSAPRHAAIELLVEHLRQTQDRVPRTAPEKYEPLDFENRPSAKIPFSASSPRLSRPGGKAAVAGSWVLPTGTGKNLSCGAGDRARQNGPALVVTAGPLIFCISGTTEPGQRVQTWVSVW